MHGQPRIYTQCPLPVLAELACACNRGFGRPGQQLVIPNKGAWEESREGGGHEPFCPVGHISLHSRLVLSQITSLTLGGHYECMIMRSICRRARASRDNRMSVRPDITTTWPSPRARNRFALDYFFIFHSMHFLFQYCQELLVSSAKHKWTA